MTIRFPLEFQLLYDLKNLWRSARVRLMKRFNISCWRCNVSRADRFPLYRLVDRISNPLKHSWWQLACCFLGRLWWRISMPRWRKGILAWIQVWQADRPCSLLWCQTGDKHKAHHPGQTWLMSLRVINVIFKEVKWFFGDGTRFHDIVLPGPNWEVKLNQLRIKSIKKSARNDWMDYISTNR